MQTSTDYLLGKAFAFIKERIQKHLDFDVLALVLGIPDLNETKILVDWTGSPEQEVNVLTLPKVFFQEIKLVDGDLIAVSNIDEEQNALCINKLGSEKRKFLKTGLTTRVTIDGLGTGFFIVASGNEKFSQYRTTLAELQVGSLLSQAFRIKPTRIPDKRDQNAEDAYFKNLFEHLGIATAVVEGDKTIVLVNREFEKLTGYAREELEHQATLSLLFPEREMKKMSHIFENRESTALCAPVTGELVCLRKNREERRVSLSLNFLPDREEVIISLQDITDYRRAELEIKEWSERTALINQVINAVNASLDFNQLIQVISSQLKKVVEFDRASLALWKDGFDELEFISIDTDGRISECQGDSTLGKRLKEALVCQKPLTENDSEPEICKELLGKTFCSYIIYPLVVEQKVIGSFNLGSQAAGAFFQYHLDILQGIASQIAVAVTKNRIYNQCQIGLRNLSRLAHINQTICSTLDVDTVLKLVVDAARQAVNAKIATIRFVQNEHLAGEITIGQPITNSYDSSRIPAKPLTRIVLEQKPLVVEDIHKQGLQGVRSFLGVPVVSRGKTIAVLSVFIEEPYCFSSTDIEHLTTIASQAAVALENARLYKETEEARNYLENIVTSSVDAIVSTDREGQITFFSKGAEEMFGYRQQQVLGKPAYEYLVGKRIEALKIQRNLLKGKKVQNYETEILTQTGQYLPVSMSVSLLQDEHKRVVGALGIGKDISEKKKAETELKKKSKELEDFVYLVSHNLKTPLVSLQGFVTLLENEIGGRLEGETQFYLERLKKNTRYMEKMIQDLLEFSKIGRIERPFSYTNISEIVEKAVDSFRFALIEKRIDIHVAPNLPSIYCNAEEIGTVFFNLISNAIKYMGDMAQPRIEVGFEEQENCYQFWVKDTGIGIEEKYHDKVFGLFQRLHGIKEIDGTGVGLTIVKKIIENHRGKVYLKSQPGKGTTVYFTLPKRGEVPVLTPLKGKGDLN